MIMITITQYQRPRFIFDRLFIFHFRFRFFFLSHWKTEERRKKFKFFLHNTQNTTVFSWSYNILHTHTIKIIVNKYGSILFSLKAVCKKYWSNVARLNNSKKWRQKEWSRNRDSRILRNSYDESVWTQAHIEFLWIIFFGKRESRSAVFSYLSSLSFVYLSIIMIIIN